VTAIGPRVRDASASERAWADRLYASIDFAATAPSDRQLIAVRGPGDEPIGLGRLVDVGDGALELGGIWTAASARGHGVAAAMVQALLDRARDRGARAVWCVPFRALIDYYARFGFVERATGWPPGIVAKAAHCAARGQDVAIMALGPSPA
jgi:GNAT superfamily N-acetyltransferase